MVNEWIKDVVGEELKIGEPYFWMFQFSPAIHACVYLFFNTFFANVRNKVNVTFECSNYDLNALRSSSVRATGL